MGAIGEKIGGIVEGLILLLLGLYVGLFVTVGDYWRYMNPKFKWLTGTAGVVLILVGLMATVRPNREARLFRVFVFLAFMSFAALPSFEPGARINGPAREEPRLLLDGQEYIRINLGELTMVCDEAHPNQETECYVLRGMVKRSRDLDRAGEFVVLRIAVFCCFADAVAMGFRVHYDRTAELYDGQWVQVYGTLRRLSSEQPSPSLPVRGAFFTMVSDCCVIMPTKVVDIEPPPIPYMFEFKKSEPHVY